MSKKSIENIHKIIDKCLMINEQGVWNAHVDYHGHVNTISVHLTAKPYSSINGLVWISNIGGNDVRSERATQKIINKLNEIILEGKANEQS